MKPQIKFIFPFAMPTGYGRAGHDYCAALAKHDVPFCIQPMHDVETLDNLEPRYHHLVPYAERQLDNITHVFVQTIPMYAHSFVTDDLAPPPGVKKVCLPTWETDRLPKEAVENLGVFDLIIVPSVHNYEVFKKAGVPKEKISVIPYPFDPDWWYTPNHWTKKTEPYVFYWIGVWSERKNPIGMLKAYLTTFTGDDPVVLKMVTPSVNVEDVESLGRSLGLDNLPKVEFVGLKPDRLTENDLKKLHQESHCYVTVSRGEGFGLGAFEAAFMGNHVIYTGWSGLIDAVSETERKKLLRFFMTPAITPNSVLHTKIVVAGVEIPCVESRAPDGIYSDQFWAEPDLGGCQGAMRHAFKKRLGLDAGEYLNVRKRYTNKFSYATVGKQIMDVLG